MTNKINELADHVMNWFGTADGDLQQEFQVARFEDLHHFHHTLGQNIRNEFRLWDQPWEPDLVGGVDMSPDHPDAVAMKVIEEVWRRVQ